MARDELVSMLVGAGAGYLIGSVGKATGTEPPLSCPECVSTPLLDSGSGPFELTIEDYNELIEFQNSPTTQILWNIFVLYDGLKYYMLYNSYNYQTNDFSITIYAFQKGVNGTGTKEIGTNPRLYANETKTILTLESSISRIEYDILNKKTTALISTPSFNAQLVQTGIPFKYNNGAIAVLDPNQSYLKGFEIPGTANGKINGVNVSGYGLTERINVSSNLFDRPYKWISVSSNNMTAVFADSLGVYKDGFIYFNGTYIKPFYFEISVLSGINDQKEVTFGGNKMIYGLFSDTNNVLHNFRIQTIAIGVVEREIAHEFAMYIDGTEIGQGLGTEESNITY